MILTKGACRLELPIMIYLLIHVTVWDGKEINGECTRMEVVNIFGGIIWSEYFCGPVNVLDDREADVCLGGGMQSEGVTENWMLKRGGNEALCKMKYHKVNGMSVEFLVEGDDSVDWLVRLFNICIAQGKALEDWQSHALYSALV